MLWFFMTFPKIVQKNCILKIEKFVKMHQEVQAENFCDHAIV